jgi:hypothetical protein
MRRSRELAAAYWTHMKKETFDVNQTPVDKLPAITLENAEAWLLAKYRRHREIEDGQCLSLIRSQAAEISRLRGGMEQLVKSAQGLGIEGWKRQPPRGTP